MGVHVYRNTDPDAPVLSDNPGALIQVLEACLVTGYGSTQAAGWEMDRLADHTKAALRSTDPAGTGCWLYLEDDRDDIGYSRATAYGLEPDAWGGFDVAGDPQITGNRFPKDRDQEFAKQADSNWILIADERAFWFFGEENDRWGIYPQGDGSVQFFGDIVSFLPSDPYGCVCGLRDDAGSRKFSIINYVDHEEPTASIARPASQVGDPKNGRSHSVGQGIYSVGGINFPVQGTNDLALLHESYFEESDGNYRGYMPGAYSYYHNGKSHAPTLPFLHDHVESNLDGRDYLTVEYKYFRNSDGPGFIIVDITGPWR